MPHEWWRRLTPIEQGKFITGLPLALTPELLTLAERTGAPTVEWAGGRRLAPAYDELVHWHLADL